MVEREREVYRPPKPPPITHIVGEREDREVEEANDVDGLGESDEVKILQLEDVLSRLSSKEGITLAEITG
jgi:hypothetical protein